MDKIKKYISIIRNDPETEKRVYLITLITALFILALAFSRTETSGKYILDDSGNVVGIHRGSMTSSEQYNLDLTIRTDDSESSRSVSINKRAAGNEQTAQLTTGENRELEREAELSGIITDIELSDRRNINLPDKLSDGTRLIWSVKRHKDSSFLLIPITYLFLIFLIVRNSMDKTEAEDKDMRKAIIRGLPRFTNQLLLMLNAGMILNDSFERISTGYRMMGEDKIGLFENEIIMLAQRNADHRISTATVISEFACTYNVKELIRIATILTENEKRGSNVIDNLSRESSYLWDERKIRARENGKLIDTRMSYPLGILLVLLIVITMAPALLNM